MTVVASVVAAAAYVPLETMVLLVMVMLIEADAEAGSVISTVVVKAAVCAHTLEMNALSTREQMVYESMFAKKEEESEVCPRNLRAGLVNARRRSQCKNRPG